MKFFFEDNPSCKILACCIPEEGETELVIPDSVTYLQPDALRDCTGVVRVVLPASIKLHSGEVFEPMTSLDAIEVSKDHPRLFSRGGLLYAKDAPSFIRLLRYPTGRGNLIFKAADDVDAIGKYAFSGAVRLRCAILHENVRDVGEGAFSRCPRLQRVMIRGRLNYIREGAFRFCEALEGVSLYKGVEHVEAHAFLGCTALRQVCVLSGLTTLGREAFALCTSLESISLYDTVRFIDSGVFYRCDALKVITCAESAAALLPSHHSLVNLL